MRFFRYVVHKLFPIQNVCVRKRGLDGIVQSQSVHLHLGPKLHAKYKDPCLLGSFDMLCLKKGNNSTEN